MGNNSITAVDAIKTMVITSLVPMIDKFPILKTLLNSSQSEKPAEEWDFFMVSAITGVILLTNEEYKGEHDAIEERLNELDRNYMKAVNDLSSFMEKTTDNLDERIATIGYWVLWNVKKDKPTDDELQQLSLPIGNYVMGVVHQIRKEKIGQVED